MCRKSEMMLTKVRSLTVGELWDGLIEVIASTLRISTGAAAHHARRTVTKVDHLMLESGCGMLEAFDEALEGLVAEFDRPALTARATTPPPRQLFIGPDGVVIGSGCGARAHLRSARIHHAQACDARSY